MHADVYTRPGLVISPLPPSPITTSFQPSIPCTTCRLPKLHAAGCYRPASVLAVAAAPRMPPITLMNLRGALHLAHPLHSTVLARLCTPAAAQSRLGSFSMMELSKPARGKTYNHVSSLTHAPIYTALVGRTKMQQHPVQQSLGGSPWYLLIRHAQAGIHRAPKASRRWVRCCGGATAAWPAPDDSCCGLCLPG